MNLKILSGDCRVTLGGIVAATVQCCVTSPPYWGLRSYLLANHPNKAQEIGQEKTPAEFVAALLAVFGGKTNPIGVWRALRDDGTLWLNLVDSYNNSQTGGNGATGGRDKSTLASEMAPMFTTPTKKHLVYGLKPKDLIGIPWRVAFALQEAGWYLRSDIIWAKPNCMPESVTDRPTRSHEYLFLLTKAPRYYYDAEAIKEPPSPELLKQISEGYQGRSTKDFSDNLAQDASATKSRIINGYRSKIDKQRGHSRRHDGFNDRWDNLSKSEQMSCGANKRDVWTIPPAAYSEAHFATFPPDLIKPCILAGTKPGDIVLDPFGGSGTTGEVALELGRKAILCELNDDYLPLIDRRTHVTPGLALA